MTSFITDVISVAFRNAIYSGSNKSTVNYSTDVNVKLQFVPCHTTQKSDMIFICYELVTTISFLRHKRCNLKIDCLNASPNITTNCCCTVHPHQEKIPRQE